MYYSPERLIDVFRNHPKYRGRSVVGPKNNPPEKSLTICTTCMNRLKDLSQTLPKNLEDNRDYKNLEWLLLDYNSTDGLGDWVQDNLMSHIRSGRLTYYRTEEPGYFHPNHSRNLSFRLARGELVANVDSDNFTMRGYAKRLNQCASVGDERLLIVPDNFLKFGTTRMKLKGRFCLYKADIERLRGFDEDLDDGFGNDDLNFVFRAMMDRFLMVRFEESFTTQRIETTNSERVKFTKNTNYEEGRDRNFEIMKEKLCRGMIDVNRGREWGKATVVKNFSEVIEL